MKRKGNANIWSVISIMVVILVIGAAVLAIWNNRKPSKKAISTFNGQNTWTLKQNFEAVKLSVPATIETSQTEVVVSPASGVLMDLIPFPGAWLNKGDRLGEFSTFLLRREIRDLSIHKLKLEKQLNEEAASQNRKVWQKELAEVSKQLAEKEKVLDALIITMPKSGFFIKSLAKGGAQANKGMALALIAPVDTLFIKAQAEIKNAANCIIDSTAYVYHQPSDTSYAVRLSSIVIKGNQVNFLAAWNQLPKSLTLEHKLQLRLFYKEPKPIEIPKRYVFSGPENTWSAIKINEDSSNDTLRIMGSFSADSSFFILENGLQPNDKLLQAR